MTKKVASISGVAPRLPSGKFLATGLVEIYNTVTLFSLHAVLTGQHSIPL